MAVIDEQTGRLLNYKQFMQDIKYKKNWITSSANEFGRLANGVGGRIPSPFHIKVYNARACSKTKTIGSAQYGPQ